MDKLLDQLNKASLGQKAGAVAGFLVLLTVLNYFVLGFDFGPSISDTEVLITRTLAERDRLQKDFIEKQAIANNLNQFRREKELLEQRLTEALAELPEEKNVDELLQLFQDRAIKSGLEINTIEPAAVKPEQFYARIPIPMTVTGNFHEIATFFDSLGRLRRIVNVSDIQLDNAKDVSGKVVVNGKFLVTTFMFVKPAGAAAPGKKN
ncbi:MAG: type 4a pilus biogenesis protein PilO [Anaeromyxobacteraceae bacterium]